MALTDSNELQAKISSLRRAPCPKPPVAGRSPELFTNIKLKPTKPVPVEKETNSADMSDKNDSNNSKPKERSSSIKDRVKMLENGSTGNKPLVPMKPVATKPKPPISHKLPIKPVNTQNNSTERRERRERPPTIIDKPIAEIQAGYEDVRVPELSPLPAVHVLGNPPKKPPKLWSLKKNLAKYVGTTHPPRPIIPEKTSQKTEVEENKTESSLPVDGPPLPKKPSKPGDVIEVSTINQNKDNENDVGDVNSKEDIDNDENSCQDFYDDTRCSEDLVAGTQGETFGEDIYEPLAAEENYELLPGESGSLPTLPPANEKKPKEQTKEDKKRKEKEEKEKRKKEKEEKEREEKERKKREKEKEKKLSDMRKRFGVRGNEPVLGTCRAAVDIQGNKMDISATIGEEFDIIRKDKPNPLDKWLVRNKLGHYGFIDVSKIEKGEDDSEDLYEEVSTVKQSMQSLGNDDISAPPAMSPPPPPVNNHSVSNTQDIYDDVAAGGTSDELYEPLPEN